MTNITALQTSPEARAEALRQDAERVRALQAAMKAHLETEGHPSFACLYLGRGVLDKSLYAFTTTLNDQRYRVAKNYHNNRAFICFSDTTKKA